MAGNRLRAAPIVTLVLSFAVVLGLGWLVGPVPSEVSQAASLPTSTVAPSTTAPASPSPEPTTTTDTATPLDSSSPPSSSFPPSPGTDPPTGQATTRTALGPDASGNVFMGVVQQESSYPDSSLDPTVTPTDDGRLQVCVHTNDTITSLRPRQDWVQIDPPDGDQRCTYVPPGTDVAFHLVPR